MSDFSIIQAEDRYLLNKPNFSTHRPGLYPSEASVEYTVNGVKFIEGGCARATYYRIKKVPIDNPGGLSLSMKAIVGKAIEQETIDRWKSMGLLVDHNIKFFNEKYIISGEQDTIIRNPETGEFIGLEQKSMSGHYAAREIFGAKRPPIPGKPKIGHYLQAIIYWWEYKELLSEYRIYYFDREGGPRCEFRIGTELINGKNVCWREQIPGDYWNYFEPNRVYYPFTMEDIYSRFDKLLNYLRKDVLPPRDYGFLSTEQIEQMYEMGDLAKKDYDPWKKDPDNNKICHWMCRYCRWPGKCKADTLNQSIKEEE